MVGISFFLLVVQVLSAVKISQLRCQFATCQLQATKKKAWKRNEWCLVWCCGGSRVHLDVDDVGANATRKLALHGLLWRLLKFTEGTQASFLVDDGGNTACPTPVGLKTVHVTQQRLLGPSPSRGGGWRCRFRAGDLQTNARFDVISTSACIHAATRGVNCLFVLCTTPHCLRYCTSYLSAVLVSIPQRGASAEKPTRVRAAVDTRYVYERCRQTAATMITRYTTEMAAGRRMKDLYACGDIVAIARLRIKSHSSREQQRHAATRQSSTIKPQQAHKRICEAHGVCTCDLPVDRYEYTRPCGCVEEGDSRPLEHHLASPWCLRLAGGALPPLLVNYRPTFARYLFLLCLAQDHRVSTGSPHTR